MKNLNRYRKYGVIFLVIAAITPFQNCSEVKFSTVPALDKIAGEPEPTPTPSPNPAPQPMPQPVPLVVCIDTNGVSHDNGSSWTTTTNTQQMLPCPNAPTRNQDYINTQGWVCQDGSIVATDLTVMPTNQISSCPAPSLQATANPALVPDGQTVQLMIESQYVEDVKYSCYTGLITPTSGQGTVKSGTLPVGSAQVPLVIKEDMICEVTAANSDHITLNAEVKIPIDCGNRVKENGKCRDFSCKQVMPLALSGGLLQVPARSVEGLCYSVKLLDAVASSSSSLTKVTDAEVVSRNHDSGGGTRNSYVLGRADLNFVMAGPRNVRLTGADNATSPILVDNFVLVGLIPSAHTSDSLVMQTQFYRSYGTSDSTIQSTDHILFRDTSLVLKSFGTGGTSTIAPLDITADIMPTLMYRLDFRALDCGGTRNLSNIYLLFQ